MIEINGNQEGIITIPKHLELISELADIVAVHAKNVNSEIFLEAYEFLCEGCLKIVAKKLKINLDDIFVVAFKRGKNCQIIEIDYYDNI